MANVQICKNAARMKKDVYNDEGDALGFRSTRFQRLLQRLKICV